MVILEEKIYSPSAIDIKWPLPYWLQTNSQIHNISLSLYHVTCHMTSPVWYLAKTDVNVTDISHFVSLSVCRHELSI